MASNYELIRADNAIAYGTRVESYGRLLADRLYSDRTHFIFELVQNAEDVGATHIHFELSQDRLIVRHNGRPFSEANVRAICGLADGTKSEDLTKIGTFGIGFKSVYGYTTAPEIHSADEHFRIIHYVHPHAVAPVPLDAGETCFVFPFDKDDLRPGEAANQVKSRLSSLGGTTLLFLRNIQRISWRCQDGTAGRYGRDLEGDGWPRRVQVWEEGAFERQAVSYLIFEREVPTAEAAAPPKVEIAFRLRKDLKTGTESIVGEEAARLVVFFPTENWLPMKCLLQGPYRTTPARDNVPPKDAWNQRLVRESATLFAELLPRIKDMGLLTPSFLGTLPLLPTDAMFAPCSEALQAALATDAYIPAADGGHLSVAEARIASSAWLRETISDAQLAQLQGKPSLRWVSGEITVDRTASLWEFLRKVLEVEELQPSVLLAGMDEAFLQAQSDEWMITFYGFLDGHEGLWRKRTYLDPVLKDVPYVRLEDGCHVQPFNANGLANACLPPDDETDFPIVKRAIARDESALAFLIKLGLKPPSPIEEVFRSILPKYEAGRLGAMTVAEHARDVGRLLTALDTLTLPDRNRLLAQLRPLRFFLAKNETSQAHSLKPASQIYLPDANLAIFFEGNPDIWYFADHPGLQGIAREAGAANRVRRLTRDIEAGQDADLEGLAFFLERLTETADDEAIARSTVLWGMLNDLIGQMSAWDRDRYFTAMLRPKKGRVRPVASEPAFVKLLKAHAWLPGEGGVLRRPSEVSHSELPEGFVRNEWLAKQLQLRPEAISLLAETLGTTADAIGEFLKHRDAFKLWVLQQEKTRSVPKATEASRVIPAASATSAVPAAPQPTPDAVPAGEKPLSQPIPEATSAPVPAPRTVERQVAPQTLPAPELPSSKAPDVERRAAKAAEKVEGAEEKRYAEARVSRRVTAGAIEPKAYLRLHNTNADGDVICQLCDGRMPFKLNGEDHFEAIQFLEAYGREVEANAVALCPNCAAEYRYACATQPETKVARMRAIPPDSAEEELVVPLELPVHERLRFTQRHFIDLAAALGDAEQE